MWVHLRGRKIDWRRARQRTSIFLPGESHGQRSPVGYSLWGCKESDMTEQLSMNMCLWIFYCIYVPHLLYPFICQWTFGSFPCLGYCIELIKTFVWVFCNILWKILNELCGQSMNSAAVNIGVHVSCQISSSEYVPSGGIAGSYSNSIFSFFEEPLYCFP